jgi:Zn-dependent protease
MGVEARANRGSGLDADGRLQFRLFGIPVTIEPGCFIMAIVLSGGSSFANVAQWLVVVVVSILVHELGHAYVGSRLGLSPSIRLTTWGGLTSFPPRTVALSTGQNVALSIAGPVAGLALGAVIVLLRSVAPASWADAEILAQLEWVNVGWSIFNLLPMLPLDGGHIASALLDRGLHARGWGATRVLSAGIGLVVFCLGVRHQVYWVAIIGGYGVLRAAMDVLERRAETRDLAHQARLDEAQAHLSAGRPAEAITVLEDLVSDLQSARMRAHARNTWARAALALGRPDEAAAQAAHMPEGWSVSADVAAGLLEAKGHVDEAIERLRSAYRTKQDAYHARLLLEALVRHRPEDVAPCLDETHGRITQEAVTKITRALFLRGHYEACRAACEVASRRGKGLHHGFNAACSLLRLGRPDEALERLARVIADGFSDASSLDHDEDIAPLRRHPGWAAVRDAATPAESTRS